jgi:hypothetical protein
MIPSGYTNSRGIYYLEHADCIGKGYLSLQLPRQLAHLTQFVVFFLGRINKLLFQLKSLPEPRTSIQFCRNLLEDRRIRRSSVSVLVKAGY